MELRVACGRQFFHRSLLPVPLHGPQPQRPVACHLSKGRNGAQSTSKSGRGLWDDIWADSPGSAGSATSSGGHGDDTARATAAADPQESAWQPPAPQCGSSSSSSSSQEQDGQRLGWEPGTGISDASPSHPDEDEGEDEAELDEGFDALGGHFNGAKFMKLVPVEGGLATLEINGVKMHITATKSPLQDAQDKVKLARVKRNSVVLDVCTGLGYSAITCVRAGAKEVYTIELEPDVLEFARQNPASQDLFTSPQIKSLLGNAFQVVQEFPDEMFNAVLHDPPRLTHAGELYSLQFYQQLFRVLRCGARLFHYTGSPRGVSSKAIPRGIKDRLMKAGFVEVKWQDSCQGFSATKP